MRISQDSFLNTLLAVALFVSCASWGQVRDSSGAAATPPDPGASERSIEDLNRLGAETAMPTFADSPINIDSDFRQKLFSEGVALRSQLTVIVRAEYAGGTRACRHADLRWRLSL